MIQVQKPSIFSFQLCTCLFCSYDRQNHQSDFGIRMNRYKNNHSWFHVAGKVLLFLSFSKIFSSFDGFFSFFSSMVVIYFHCINIIKPKFCTIVYLFDSN